MRKLITAILFFSLVTCVGMASAASVTVKMYKTAPKGQGVSIGAIEFVDTARGLLIMPHLTGLPAGNHGFHVHENPSCADNGKAAGGHYDPQHTGKHLGPYNKGGHLGDMPYLTIDADGQTTTPLLAPRLTVSDLKGRSIMIHAGGDNYSDKPKPLGGGGARIACGVVK